jgi:cell division protein FtsB
LWLLIILVFGALSWWGDNGYQTVGRLRAQRVALQRENQTLQQSNDRLGQEIRLVQQDPSFMEWIVKEKLGMIGENERLYVFQK